jgi:diguanylate cyclase (GGDEF)-like protein
MVRESSLESPGLGRSRPRRAPTNPELIRTRLRLALLAVGVVPLALASALLYVASPGRVPIEFLALFPLVGICLVPIVIWLPRHLLRLTGLEQQSSEVRRRNEAARTDTLRDALTGLGNHRAFQEELDRQLELYNRYQVRVALLVIDLDDLKLVNDSEGHAAGDEMVRELGRIIHQSVRYSDRAFRIGGDEFAVLMPHTDAAGAQHLAKRLQERATQSPSARPVPFSGGISVCPQLATTRSQLYAQADAALYWCKRHGRSAVEVFHPVRDQGANVEATGDLSAAIARVISEGRLRPVYQPIVDLNTGQVLGFEGLVRPSPESGFADPGAMFVAADAVGRTVELDQACLQTVVAGARAVPANQLLTVNISPRTVEAPHFSADSLLAVLERNGIEPGRVVVELTERETVQDISRLQATLSALQRAGVRIAADDVGAGNAGLRLLSQFRFDIVKIDLSLVQEGAEKASSWAVLRSLRDLAGRWGAAVIAEGVETVSQLRTVRELGMTAGQGYLLGRPMPHPTLTSVDIAAIDAGVVIMGRQVSSTGGGAGTAGAPGVAVVPAVETEIRLPATAG